LTDYHLHLRPDDAAATPERYFTSANAEVYREAADARGISELGVSEHIYRFVREETDLRLGIEMDFVAGAEDRTAALLDARDLDYVVGSVHFISESEGAVDMEPFTAWDPKDPRRSPERVWGRYFEAVAASARSGLFDIIAH